ncbi:High mobility group box 1 [Coemansia biformis]|uniref:High mobility group box 1 n=1 Tax=Coemansia biformis TaxID=1286918 RepID=A0A9W7YBU2_9FUNG|nr:High mobility group box 1 [Coemansia biformis]
MPPARQTDMPQGFMLSAEDAHELSEGYYKLALVYSRISGVRLNAKLAAGPRYRDPDRPKRPPTAYLLFSVDKRPSVAAEFPGMKSQDVASKIGESWRGLAPDDRARYTNIAADLRKKYFSDLVDYKRRKYHQSKLPFPDDDEEDEEDEEDAGAGAALDQDDLAFPIGDAPVISANTPAAVAAPAPDADSDAPATNGHSKKKKKRRSGEPGAEKKSRRSRHEGGDAAETPKKKKKRSKEAAQ